MPNPFRPQLELMSNPLLDLTGLPHFDQIQPQHIQPALDQQLARAQQTVNAVKQTDSITWDDLVQPLEDMNELLSRLWSPVAHLNAVADSDELRREYEVGIGKLTAWFTELGQDAELYRRYQVLRDSVEFEGLETAQKKIIDNAIRDFKLSGIALPTKKQARFKAIEQELAQLSNQFSQHVLDASQAWTLDISDQSDLDGLPESARELARQRAEHDDVSGWRFTLELPYYLPIMQYAAKRSLRKQMYKAYSTRASDRGPNAPEFDNGPLIERILSLRTEIAQLLGYNTYAQMSLVPKMAESVAQVLDFLRDLARRARPIAERELADLQAYAHQLDQLAVLEPWDITYYSEKQRQALFDFSDEDSKPYFPIDRVINGMFDVVARLYGLQINPGKGVSAWHPDVQFFDILDGSGELRGQFYLDLYVRPHKRGGAWMDECISRKRTAHSVQTPVAYLTCNVTPPIGNQPALLTHDEVQTLFHEFGHGLHHMLTQVDYQGVAGISGVAWDAVELPSQFMENWCWQTEAMTLISGHYETGEPIPTSLLAKMQAAKNYQTGMQTLRQIEFSLFDMLIHDSEQPVDVLAELDRVRQQVAVVIPPEYHRFPHAFSHIFAGGYAAGYYSYKWAEVLSADAFSRFEDEGIFNRKTGEAFLHSILEQGGSREPMELFVAFRGREPSIESLLKQDGLFEAV